MHEHAECHNKYLIVKSTERNEELATLSSYSTIQRHLLKLALVTALATLFL